VYHGRGNGLPCSPQERQIIEDLVYFLEKSSGDAASTVLRWGASRVKRVEPSVGNGEGVLSDF